jgi:hypothetical protein
MRRYDRPIDLLPLEPSEPSVAPAPGRRTLTMSLPPRAPVQRNVRVAAGEQADRDRPDLGALVADATRDAGEALPFAETVQARFGRHDVSQVRAHQGDAVRRAAQELGAEAFATGHHVAFAGMPTLRTVLHETAHVVQQRSGGVTTQGLGAADDHHERHADEVADRGVRGESVEGLLDRYAPPASSVGGGAASLQLMRVEADERQEVESKSKGPAGEAALLERLAGGYDTDDLDDTDRALLLGAIRANRYHLKSEAREKELMVALGDGGGGGGSGRGKRKRAKESDRGTGSDAHEVPPEAESPAWELSRLARAVALPGVPPDEGKAESGEASSSSAGGRGQRTARVSPAQVEKMVQANLDKKFAKLHAPLDESPELQALSRLARLLEASFSGGTCTAVLKIGRVLVVSANAGKDGMAANMSKMLAALQGTEYDPIDTDIDDFTGVPAGYGAAPNTKEHGDKINAKTAQDLVTDSLVSERAFGLKKDDTAREAKVPDAEADAQRRIGKVRAWLGSNPIEKVVVHAGTAKDVHAEMRLLDSLHWELQKTGTAVTGPIQLGISKICCGLCWLGVQLFRKLNPGVVLEVQGAHGNTYEKWTPPLFVERNLEAFTGVAASSAPEIQAQVHKLRGYKTKNLSTKKGATGYFSDGEEADEA